MLVLFETSACPDEISRFTWNCGIGALGIPVQDSVNDFAKSSAAQLRRGPAVFRIIPND
jgi:hypothetical protein